MVLQPVWKHTKCFSRLIAHELSIRRYSSPSAVAKVLQNYPNRTTASTWSSPNDRIIRNVFSSNYVHAWTLLEACLEQENMSRAESVLFGLAEISGPTDIALAVNTFLQRLIETNENKPDQAISWLKKIEYQIPKFKENDATCALMLRNASVNFKTSPKLLEDQVSSMPRGKLLNLLKQFEILGGINLQKIMEVANILPEELDLSTKLALSTWKANEELSKEEQQSRANDSNTSSQSARMQSTLNWGGGKIAEPIRKEGFETLEQTASPGLVAVRHVLSGLQRRSQAEQRNISEMAELAELPHVQNKSNDEVDFFEIWKQLKTNEEKEKFDALLEEINERRQRNLETRGIEAAKMRWRQMFEQMAEADRAGSGKVQFKGLDTLLWEWNQAMMPLVDAEMKRLKLLTPYSKVSEVPKSILEEHFPGMKTKTISDRIEYAPYLTLAKAENLPAMTMMELLRLNSKNRENVRSVVAIVSVGKNVEREYKLEVRKRNMKNSSLKGKKNSQVQTNGTGNAIENSSKPLKQRVESITHSWPVSILAKIGSVLISMLMQAARVRVSGTDPVSGKKIRSTAPAFHHTYQYQNGTTIGILRPHKVVGNYLSGERISIQPQQLPMLCKPRRWTSWDNGGYWYTPSTIVRSKDSPEQTAYVAAASERGRIQKIFDGLNVLGEVPWTINKSIFKIVSHVWNTKERFLDIPPHVPPVADLASIPVPPRDSDPSVLRDYRRKCRAATLENGSLYSQRCDLNYKLDIARALLGERFYMPHNVDFRGRAYPLSPHFNHLGNDVSRSLLIFWEGKKLGAHGFWWLKVHLANLFGLSKSNHAERVQFVEENMEKTLKSAEDPLSEEGSWWKTADSPFQALATCMEIKSAMEHPEGPENFESHLTVHQDGSCNGLQHYAALGGDYDGACQVNLQSAERPQDVYTRVLEIVKIKVQNESNKTYKPLAEMILPVLGRKVVKQTVMTHVYGVTFVGARAQIANRLREIDAFPSDQVFKGASYLARRILEAVRELFESAHEIQEWLGDNATRISRAIVTDADLRDVDLKFVSSVIWTSPLGLPIVQPYRQEKRKLVSTELQTLLITDPYSFQGVNSRKQRTAFPPNYIHSLDATHMFMSALACAEHNIAFAAVHDSYWTHACDVGTLSTQLRKCFVELHSDNLIEKLREEFQHRYGNHLEVIKIPVESEPGQKIKAMHNAFSMKKYGKKHKLSIFDQVELETNKEEGELTPLDVMRDLTTTEVSALSELVAKSSTKVQARVRSTEHAGTGVEPDELEAEDDGSTIGAAVLRGEAFSEEVAEENVEEAPKLKKQAAGLKGIEVLVPLRVPDIPTRGSFDVKNVLDSPYFFS